MGRLEQVEIRRAKAADGVHIAFFAVGEGPPLLMLPMLPISHLEVEWHFDQFRDFILRLGAGHTLVRYDSRGLGVSDPDPPDFSLHSHLLDVLAVLDELGIESSDVVAPSYAGPIGMAFAARYPDRVHRLILWCTHPNYASVAELLAPDRAAQRTALFNLSRVDPSLAIQTYIHHAIDWFPGMDASELSRLALKTISPDKFFPQLDIYAAFDARQDLGSIRAPTLVMHPADFQSSDVAVARSLAESIPGSRLVLTRGSSAVPFLTDPDAFLDPLDEFLGRSPPPPSAAVKRDDPTHVWDDGTPLPLIGRDQELGIIRSSVASAARGSGVICLVGGDPGTGKSRLLEEAEVIGKDAGALVVVVGNEGAHFAPAMWCWTQVAREIDARATGSDALAAARDVLSRLLPGYAPGSGHSQEPVDATTSPFLLLDSTHAYLRAAAAELPLVVILDDIHQADDSSLAMLAFLAHHINGLRIAVFAAVDQGKATSVPSLRRTLAQLARQPAVRRVALGNFDRSAVAELAAAVVGQPLEPDALERMYEDTEGNPFYAIELARHWLRQGYPTASGSLPESVKGIVIEHLADLSLEALALLEQAAVIGREFDLSLLRAMRRPSPDTDLLGALEEAERIGVIRESPGKQGSYEFANTLIRSIVYEEIPSPRRARIHQDIGLAMESRPGILKPELLAHHFVAGMAAGTPDKALEYSRAAGDAAFALFAYEQAAKHYANASRASEQAGGPLRQRAQLLISTAEARTRSGDVRGGKEAYRQAIQIARDQNEPEMLAAAALGYGDLDEEGIPDEHGARCLREALDTLPRSDSALRARVLSLLGRAVIATDHGEGLALTAQAIDVARRVADPATTGYVLDRRAEALAGTENWAERRALAAEMLRLAEEARSDSLRLEALRWHMVNGIESGDIAGIEEDLAAYERTAELIREPYYLWKAASMRAGFEVLQSRCDPATSAIETARVRAEALQTPGVARYLAPLQQFMLCRSRGMTLEVEAELRALGGVPPGKPGLRMFYAAALNQAGKTATARATYEAAWHAAGNAPLVSLGLAATCIAAELCVAFRDTSRAEAVEAAIAPHAGAVASFADGALVLGPVTRFLGLLRSLRPADPSWQGMFAQALETSRALSAPALVAEAAFEWAAELIASGRDHQRATELLEEADRLAAVHGLVGIQAKVQSCNRLSPDLVGPGSERVLYPANLTEREAEILVYLARGFTNKQTARELVLSARTVERHIQNAYAKIGAHTRAQATAFVLEHGLEGRPRQPH